MTKELCFDLLPYFIGLTALFFWIIARTFRTRQFYDKRYYELYNQLMQERLDREAEKRNL